MNQLERLLWMDDELKRLQELAQDEE